MKALFSTAYWPNLHYFYYLLHSESICIEQHEHYQKQSFRNRTSILSANGVLDLSIPVRKQALKEFTKDVAISYAEAWQMKHWRAIISAYKNSPYFEHFEEELAPLYQEKHEFLLEFNLKQLQLILKILKQPKSIKLTEVYQKEVVGYTDLRERIHPKLDFRTDEEVTPMLLQPYYQTFESKFDFSPNLSILDLLFNKGLGTLDYLG